jgi:hypothetical protein
MPAQVLFLSPVSDAQLNVLVARGPQLLGLGGDDEAESWRSSDGGATWRYRRSSMLRGRHELVTLAPDGRLCSSSSWMGARWSRGLGLPRWHSIERADGLIWWSLAVDEEGTLWRGGQLGSSAGCGAVAYSTDGGRSWTRVASQSGQYFPFSVSQVVCFQGKVYLLHGKGISICTRAGTERTWLPNIGFLRSLAFSPSGAMLVVGETGVRVAASSAGPFKQVRIPGVSAWGFRQAAWVPDLGFVLTAVTGVYTSDLAGQVWGVAAAVQPALDAARGKKGADAFGAVTPLSAGRALVGTLQGDLIALEA